MWRVDGGVRCRNEGYRGKARAVMVHSGTISEVVLEVLLYFLLLENTHAAIRYIDHSGEILVGHPIHGNILICIWEGLRRLRLGSWNCK